MMKSGISKTKNDKKISSFFIGQEISRTDSRQNFIDDDDDDDDANVNKLENDFQNLSVSRR